MQSGKERLLLRFPCVSEPSPALLGTKTLPEKTNSQEADSMRQKFIAVLVLLVAIVAVGRAGLAQDTSTEAPAGFDTPTLVQTRLSEP